MKQAESSFVHPQFIEKISLHNEKKKRNYYLCDCWLKMLVFLFLVPKLITFRTFQMEHNALKLLSIERKIHTIWVWLFAISFCPYRCPLSTVSCIDSKSVYPMMMCRSTKIGFRLFFVYTQTDTKYTIIEYFFLLSFCLNIYPIW